MRRLGWLTLLLPVLAVVVGMHVPAHELPAWLRSIHGEVASLHGGGRAAPVSLVAPVDVPFNLVNRHILIPVSVNDAALVFMLDTRDKVGIIDLNRARTLGLRLGGPVTVVGAGNGSTAGALVSDAGFTMAGLPGVIEPIRVAFPLAHLSAVLGRAFDGVFGTDFISHFVVEVDYEGRQIRLHDPATWSYTGPGESIPIELDANGHPVFAAAVTTSGGERLEGRFSLDLGASTGLTLSTPFVAEHHLPGANVRTVRSLLVVGTGGAAGGRVGRIAGLTIGSQHLTDVRTMFSTDTAGADASADIQGSVGQPIASRFRLFLDYQHHRIVFEPVADPPEADPPQAGFAVAAEGPDLSTLRVTDVLDESPASEAGLRVGDVIQAIAGRTAGLTVMALLDRLERSGPCVLTVQRGGSTLTMTVTPRRIV